jgi:hypothetical protein
MQINPTLASHDIALNRSKNQVLRERTPELHDSKEPTTKLTPQNTRKNTYNTLKNTLKSQLFGPTNPSHTTIQLNRDRQEAAPNSPKNKIIPPHPSASISTRRSPGQIPIYCQ